MLPGLLAFATVIATFAGGITALKHKDAMHRFLGFAAGVLLAVVAFDLLPEIFHLLNELKREPTIAMIALVCGFLVFHIVERSILIHHSQEAEYEVHHHPNVGVASALALIGHSFLDGVGIGLGFQAGTAIGITVAIAVIAHDFTDGLNTVNLMLLNKNRDRRAVYFLIADALAPAVGIFSTLFFTISPLGLVLYLSFFAGFLLYIGASEILPEAHSKHSSYQTIALTITGVVFTFIVTRFA